MKERIAENFLYHIWDEQHLKPSLCTIDGKSLRILFQGKWNTDAGPDFINSILLINNEKLQGDIEIHRSEYDWKAHNHHEDPNYNNVILHVVFENTQNKEYTITENGNEIPILELQNNLDEQLHKLWTRYGGKPFDRSQKDTIKCLLSKKITHSKQLKSVLENLGLERFHKKCKRFSAELVNSDFNQILYEGIFEALGYTKNKIPFYKLAKLLTYRRLQTLLNVWNDEQELFLILLFASGLSLEDYHFEWINESLKHKNRRLLSELSGEIHQIEKTSWNFFRCRPGNYPVNRMWQISPFLYHTLRQGNIINTVIAIFSIPSDKKLKPKYIQKKFIELVGQHEHHTIGTSRSKDIFANIILPVSFVYAQTLNYKNMQQFILEVYSGLSKLSDNYITQYMHSILEQNMTFPVSLMIQQGMIQLYYQFCAHHDCQNCVNNLL